MITAQEAKTAADHANARLIREAQADMEDIFKQIRNAASLGLYKASHSFMMGKTFPLVNETRNQLTELGFDIEITEVPGTNGKHYVIDISWAKE